MSDIQVGNATVITTNNRALTPEEFASLATNKIISVSLNSPPAIRDQAIAFRDRVQSVIENYIRMAIESDRACRREK